MTIVSFLLSDQSVFSLVGSLSTTRLGSALRYQESRNHQNAYLVRTIAVVSVKTICAPAFKCILNKNCS